MPRWLAHDIRIRRVRRLDDLYAGADRGGEGNPRAGSTWRSPYAGGRTLDSGCREPLCEPSNRPSPADRVERVTDQPDLSTTAGKIADLRARYQEAVVDAEKAAQEKQHAKGKLTARERIELLVDPGSFVELHHRRQAQTTRNRDPGAKYKT